MNYRRITEKVAVELNFSEAYTFYCMAMKSDYNTLVSHIKQDTLASLVGVDVSTIQRHIYRFEEAGLLTKTTKCINSLKMNTYKLIDDNYKYITDQLMNEPISRELKGFLVILKCRCYNCSNNCQYSVRGLADTLVVGKSTVDKYLRLAEEAGYITRDKKGITIVREDIFIAARESTYYYCVKTYPEILTDEDIAAHKIITN